MYKTKGDLTRVKLTRFQSTFGKLPDFWIKLHKVANNNRGVVFNFLI